MIEPHPRIAERALVPRYTFAEAGRLAKRRPETLRRWSLGHHRSYRGEHRHDPPLISIDGSVGGDTPPLSFLNLIELRFLATWREYAPLPTIRDGLRYAAESLGADRPLLQLEFKRQGRDLFVRFEEHLINPARHGQLGWPDEASELLDALDYEGSAARRWWPLGRAIPVAVDTQVNGGRPTTIETGVRTISIATRLRDGWSVAEITDDTSASAAEIEAAAKIEGLAIPA